MSNRWPWGLLVSAVVLVPPLWLLWSKTTGTRDRLMWAGLALTPILLGLDAWTTRAPNAACFWGIPLMFVTNAFLLSRLGDARQRSCGLSMMPIGVAMAAMPLVSTAFPGFGREWVLWSVRLFG